MSQNESHQLGLKHYEAGELALALDAFKAAADDYRAAGDEAMVGEMLNNIAVAQRGMQNWAAALEAVDAAIALFRKLGDRRRAAQALGNRGSILEENGDLNAAGDALAAAVEIYNGLDERDERAYVLNLLGKVRLKQGRRYDGLVDLEAGLSDMDDLSGQQRWLRRLLKLPAKLLRG